MKTKKPTKKQNNSKGRAQDNDVHLRGKLGNDKVKYKHKNHWLEEDMENEVSFKVRKKKNLE